MQYKLMKGGELAMLFATNIEPQADCRTIGLPIVGCVTWGW